jgi:SAM-dependent methyltransferase
VTCQRAAGELFSTVSVGYAAFRPRYPRSLFECIASLTTRHRRAWEAGAGSGQATTDLAEWFEEVVATDVSADQIAQAPPRSNVLWLAAAAESPPLRSASVDLIAAAQAAHWFDHERFIDAVRRVAAPGAVIALWTYAAGRMDGAVGDALRRFTFETMGPYWPPERQYVNSEYRTIPFPFERIQTPTFQLEHEWPIARLVGFLRTWSAVAQYKREHDDDPVSEIERELSLLWGDPALPRRIVWPLFLLAGRVSAP